MNHLTRMVFDYIYEQIDREDEKILEKITEYPRDYFEDTYGDLRKSDDELAEYIWCEGYDTIDWRELGEAFRDVLDDLKKGKEEEEQTDAEETEESEEE